MAETFTRFNTADLLQTEEDAADYLEAAEHQDAATLAMALATVARPQLEPARPRDRSEPG